MCILAARTVCEKIGNWQGLMFQCNPDWDNSVGNLVAAWVSIYLDEEMFSHLDEADNFIYEYLNLWRISGNEYICMLHSKCCTLSLFSGIEDRYDSIQRKSDIQNNVNLLEW